MCLLILLFFRGHSQDERKYKISEIKVLGNKSTKSRIVLREFTFNIGDSLSISELTLEFEQTYNNLYNTRLFESIDFIDSIADKEIYVKCYLEERSFITFSFEPKVADRNFNVWLQNKDFTRIQLNTSTSHYNLFGRRHRINIHADYGWKQQLGLEYEIPYIDLKQTFGVTFSGKISQGYELGTNTINNQLAFYRSNSILYQENQIGFGFTKRSKLYSYHLIKFNYLNLSVRNELLENSNVNYLGFKTNNIKDVSFQYSYIYDHRNSNFYPLLGSFLEVSPKLERIFTENSNETHFASITSKYVLYKNLFREFYGAILGRISLSSLDSLPYRNLNSLGYRYFVRGYENYLIDGIGNGLIRSEIKKRIINESLNFKFVPIKPFRTTDLQIFFKFYNDLGYVFHPNPLENNSLPNTFLLGYGLGFDIIAYTDNIARIESGLNNLGEFNIFIHYISAF